MQFDADKTAFIKGLYVDTLGRAPDAEGLAFWEEYPDENLVPAFMAEAQKELDKRPEIIANLYKEILGREPDEEGFEFWKAYKPWCNLIDAFKVEARKELNLRTA